MLLLNTAFVGRSLGLGVWGRSALPRLAGKATTVNNNTSIFRPRPASMTGGKFSGINKPTSGARTEKDLPVGEHPIQLYSMATPNGQKVTVALEEMGLKYDAWFTNIMEGDQFTSGFVAVNPNSKIPAMVVKEGPGGKSMNLFETGNILLHLAEMSGKFLPKDPAGRAECLNWLFFNIGEAPYFGQFGHFTRYAPETIEYAVTRYGTEVMRALDVLDKQLEGKSYLCGDDYTIADMAWLPWVRGLDVFYEATEKLELASYSNVVAWRARLEERPATALGLKVNSSAEDEKYKEFHSS